MGDTDTMNERAWTGGSRKKKGKKAQGKKATAEKELVSPTAKVAGWRQTDYRKSRGRSHVEEKQEEEEEVEHVYNVTSFHCHTHFVSSTCSLYDSCFCLDRVQKGDFKLAASIASLATEDTTDGEWTRVSKSKPSKAASATSLATGGTDTSSFSAASTADEDSKTGEEGGEEELWAADRGTLPEKSVHERLLPRARKTEVKEHPLRPPNTCPNISTHHSAERTQSTPTVCCQYLISPTLSRVMRVVPQSLPSRLPNQDHLHQIRSLRRRPPR
ncbi:hypothetical protein K435DRAFT_206609 [Dendrothele bispora CBS 962.96]|uniref:Uncharacterized protein n=1 Tax=Dendrothele bispora (strain CBS 962.96) TaxID=1314807 RepID=A0A4V4HEW3_DENBC|nr:hypothetical protein K435DRAFT_206609 [Dendrothele bispora CBS 962.96]